MAKLVDVQLKILERIKLGGIAFMVDGTVQIHGSGFTVVIPQDEKMTRIIDNQDLSDRTKQLAIAELLGIETELEQL